MTTLFKSSGSPSAESERIETSVHHKRWRALFFGRNGLRAGWRLAMFVIGFAALSAFFQSILIRIPACAEMIRTITLHGTLTPAVVSLIASVGIVALFVPAFIMAHIEKRPWRAYGIPFRGAIGKFFWRGAAAGLAFETLIIATIAALGGFSILTVALSAGAMLKYACLWALGFLLIGVQEEFRFRGYLQFTLASGIGFWPSAILLSLLSGLANRGPGATWVGIAEGTMFGLFACLTLQRTGNLWFAIGFRAAADFAETFIYAVPDSGLLPTHSLLNSSLHGPRWLTGGAPGPQESVVTFVMFFVAIVVFAWTCPAQENAPNAGQV